MVSLVPFLSALLLLNNLDLPVAQQGGHLEITLVSYYDIDRRLPPGTTGNRKCCSPPSDEAEKLDVCDSSCNNEIVPCHPQYNPGGPNCPGEALPLPSFHTQPDEPDEDGVSDVQSYYFANSNIEFPFSGDWKVPSYCIQLLIELNSRRHFFRRTFWLFLMFISTRKQVTSHG
eukprot:m.18945 g.18945  ORF g.18945 m.18945 type:complete len:173 (+) comp27759_c0_seq2:132-650(+)